MKNKLKTWLNIITICFCFAAIAVGIYAANTASLTVSGTIGFSAHNCKVSVNGYIYGHGATLTNGTYVDDAGGYPVPAPTAEDGSDKVMLSESPINIEGGVSTEAASTLSLGDRYFTDMSSETGKPNDIFIVISATNTSQHYQVKATVDTTALTFGKVQASVVGSKSKVLDTTGDEATAIFTFQLALTAETDGSYADIPSTALQAVSLKMKFEKYEDDGIPDADSHDYLTFDDYDLDNLTVSVTACDSSVTVAVIPSKVRHDDVVYDVTSISTYAFSSCSNLTSITIGENVESMGGYMFTNCEQLKTVYIDSATALAAARNITCVFNYTEYVYIEKTVSVDGYEFTPVDDDNINDKYLKYTENYNYDS